MTTYAPELLEALAEREREAWNAYRDGLRGLAGGQYEAVEAESWAELQDELAEVGAERAALEGQPSPE